MIEFEVKSKTQPIGKRKGQTVYFAQPVSQQHLTNKMVVDRIVRETSLSAGDDPQRRRLQNLTVNSGGNTIMDNAYTYDANSKYINKKINIPSKRNCSQVTRTYLSDHYSI